MPSGLVAPRMGNVLKVRLQRKAGSDFVLIDGSNETLAGTAGPARQEPFKC